MGHGAHVHTRFFQRRSAGWVSLAYLSMRQITFEDPFWLVTRAQLGYIQERSLGS